MIYKLEQIHKDSILNLFDFDYDNFFHSHTYDRKEFIEALCYFLSFFSTQKGIRDLTQSFYDIQETFGEKEVEQYFKNFIFVNQILITKYSFNFLQYIQKDLETISKFEVDDEEYLMATCEECMGDGEVFHEEDEDCMIICTNCGGSGQEEQPNYNHNSLSDKSIDVIQHIEINFKNKTQDIIDNIIQIILEEELHPDISNVYKPYKMLKNVESF